jgi:hypothetical protein
VHGTVAGTAERVGLQFGEFDACIRFRAANALCSEARFKVRTWNAGV